MQIKKNIIRVIIIFCMIVCLNSIVFAGSFSLTRELDRVKEILDLNLKTSVLNLLIATAIVLIAMAVIIASIIFRKKIKKELNYTIISVSVIVICMIAIIYGEELIVFLNTLLEYELNMINQNMLKRI